MRLIDADALMKELGITSDDCCECEWGDGSGYCSRTSDFTEACDAICTALPIEPEPHWIPCNERLPEPVAPSQRREWFITSNQYGGVTLTCYEFEASPFEDGWQTDMTILAWKPLPEPYNPDDFSQYMNPPED